MALLARSAAAGGLAILMAVVVGTVAVDGGAVAGLVAGRIRTVVPGCSWAPAA